MYFRHFLSPVLFLASLTACSAQQCDPDQANLFSGIGCSMGGYQERTAHYEQEYRNARRQAQDARGKAASAQARQRDAEALLADRQAQLSRLDQESWALRKKVKQLEAQRSLKGKKASELKAAQSRLRKFNQVRAKTSAEPSAKDIQNLSEILGGV